MGFFDFVKKAGKKLDDTKGKKRKADGEPDKGPKTKKKKALKIKVGKTTGSRVVFDEEGQAMQPLAQLALPESNECAAHPFYLYSTQPV